MINPQLISLTTENFKSDEEFWTIITDRFLQMQLKKIPQKYPVKSGGKSLIIVATADSDDMTLDYNTHEGYNLTIINEMNDVKVSIFARNFFGIRHGLETLAQLIVHDELNNQLVMLSSASIEDEPKFRHRGISMDTSRNFYPVDVIKRTINGLAMSKMNSFHWHITDTQSFPMQVDSHPELARIGAYSLKKIYTAENIKEIVRFAKSRGIRVIPEFDAPAHVGEGWQKKDLTTCLNYVPYLTYCWQPPCGKIV